MNRPTPEQIKEIVYRCGSTVEGGVSRCIEELTALFVPELKPLSDKLEWYKKLAKKIDMIQGGHLSLDIYENEVLHKIVKIERELIALGYSPETKQ